MISLFDYRHPHERVFDAIDANLNFNGLSHLVVCYGGIDGQEINAEIQALLVKTGWNIQSLQKERYWNLFARHVSVIHLEAPYFTQQDYSLVLRQVDRTVGEILGQQPPRHEAATVVTGALQSVQFGEKGEVPQQFGWWNSRISYDDVKVVGWLKHFLPSNLQEVKIKHPITLHFFDQLIVPLRELKRLEVSFDHIHSTCNKEKGFEPQNQISRKTLLACLSCLPRGIVHLDLGISFSDPEIEFISDLFPSLENLSVEGGTNQTLPAIKKFSSLTSLSIDSGQNFSEDQWAYLAKCTRLTSLKIRSKCPSLSRLSPHLPVTLTALHAFPFASFCSKDVSSLKRFPQLRHLTLHDVCENAKVWLGDLVQNNPLLETLDIEGCELTAQEVRFLHFEFPSLKSLILGDRWSKEVFKQLQESVNLYRERRPEVKVELVFEKDL